MQGFERISETLRKRTRPVLKTITISKGCQIYWWNIPLGGVRCSISVCTFKEVLRYSRASPSVPCDVKMIALPKDCICDELGDKWNLDKYYVFMTYGRGQGLFVVPFLLTGTVSAGSVNAYFIYSYFAPFARPHWEGRYLSKIPGRLSFNPAVIE